MATYRWPTLGESQWCASGTTNGGGITRKANGSLASPHDISESMNLQHVVLLVQVRNWLDKNISRKIIFTKIDFPKRYQLLGWVMTLLKTRRRSLGNTLSELDGDEEIRRTCSHNDTPRAREEIASSLNSEICNTGSIQKLCTSINSSASFSIAARR